MPPRNPQRRSLLTDAAISLLSSKGVHGLTHRAVEDVAGLPRGTASNYFPSRDSLIDATAERIIELHLADADAASRAEFGPAVDGAASGPADVADTHDRLIELLAAALWQSATVERERYLAVFELQFEAGRRPSLAIKLSRLADIALERTSALHAEIGLTIPAESAGRLIRLYNGLLFTLVAEPPDRLRSEEVRALTAAIVHGTLIP